MTSEKNVSLNVRIYVFILELKVTAERESVEERKFSEYSSSIFPNSFVELCWRIVVLLSHFSNEYSQKKNDCSFAFRQAIQFFQYRFNR